MVICCTIVSNTGGCSMNLAIYRCKVLVNHMKSIVAAKKTSARYIILAYIVKSIILVCQN